MSIGHPAKEVAIAGAFASEASPAQDSTGVDSTGVYPPWATCTVSFCLRLHRLLLLELLELLMWLHGHARAPPCPIRIVIPSASTSSSSTAATATRYGRVIAILPLAQALRFRPRCAPAEIPQLLRTQEP